MVIFSQFKSREVIYFMSTDSSGLKLGHVVSCTVQYSSVKDGIYALAKTHIHAPLRIKVKSGEMKPIHAMEVIYFLSTLLVLSFHAKSNRFR